VVGLFLLFALLAFYPARAATAPTVLNYQGKIIENGAVVTTTKPMAFLLFDASEDGNLKYTAAGTLTATSTITVSSTQGVFSVNIGGTGTNSLDPSIFQNNTNIYLEVWVNGERLTPRRQLLTVPYSFNANI